MDTIYQQLIKHDQIHNISMNEVDAYINELVSDVQDLLNTRTSNAYNYPASLRQSILNYGLADLSNLNIESEMDHRSLCDTILFLIETFEPRLYDVHVEPLIESELVKLTFCFNIRASFKFKHQSLSLAFNSMFQPTDCIIKIRDYYYE